MNKTIAAAAALSLMAATPALANPVQINKHGSPAQSQVYGDGSSANSNINRQHQRQSQHQSATGGTAFGGTGYSTSAAIGNGGNVTNNVVAGGSGGGGWNSGGLSITVPDVGGNAPCGGGISIGGLSLGGGGSAGGGLWEFGDCKRIREAAALDHMGYRLEAVRELCQIDRVKDAFGGKCPALPPQPDPVNADTQTKNWPDWCYTYDAGKDTQHWQCDKYSTTTVTVLGHSE